MVNCGASSTSTGKVHYHTNGGGEHLKLKEKKKQPEKDDACWVSLMDSINNVKFLPLLCVRRVTILSILNRNKERQAIFVPWCILNRLSINVKQMFGNTLMIPLHSGPTLSHQEKPSVSLHSDGCARFI